MKHANASPHPSQRLLVPFRPHRFRARCSLLLLCVVLLSACGTSHPLVLAGTVEAESVDIVTEVSGRIDSVLVAEGATVQEGDIIATLDAAMQQLSVEQLEQAVAARQAQLMELENGSRPEQITQAEQAVAVAAAQYEEARNGPSREALSAAEAQAAIAKASVAQADEQAAFASKNREDAETLHAGGALSDAGLEEARHADAAAAAALRTAQSQHQASLAQLDQVRRGAGPEAIAAARARMDQAQAQLAQVQNGATTPTLLMAEADLAQSEAALAQGRLMLEKYTLRAPCAGTVTLLSRHVGEVLNTGSAIGTISKLEDLSIRLYMPQKHLAAIHPGDSIPLTATSFPGIQIPGRITYIADEAEFTPRNTETTASKESTVFRFEVDVENPASGLKPGMALEATIPGALVEE